MNRGWRSGSQASLSLACSLVLLVSCSAAPDSERANEIFADCLERNGVDFEDLEVTVDGDGSVGNISVTILSESETPYEPTVRLGCIDEVELNP